MDLYHLYSLFLFLVLVIVGICTFFCRKMELNLGRKGREEDKSVENSLGGFGGSKHVIASELVCWKRSNVIFFLPDFFFLSGT